ncbi:unnamed protein product, partial [Didymodactylos carnosus]
IDAQKLQATLIKVKKTSFSQISDLESLLSTKEKTIPHLEEKLQTQSDYDEIKRELSILKSVDNIIDKTSEQPLSLLTPKTFFSPLLLNRVKNEPAINENNQCLLSSIPSLLTQQQQQQKLTICNDNYRNWLMLNGIVRNIDLLNQLNGMKNDEKKCMTR